MDWIVGRKRRSSPVSYLKDKNDNEKCFVCNYPKAKWGNIYRAISALAAV